MNRPRRHRIAIEREIDIPVFAWPVWRRVCETWAEIHGDLITIRHKPDLFPGMRVKVGPDYFEIVGVVDRLGKPRLTELHITRASSSMHDALAG